MGLGAFIDKELAYRNWSQRELSRRTYDIAAEQADLGLTGIEPSTVSELVRDVREARLGTLYVVALAFATAKEPIEHWLARMLIAAGYPVEGPIQERYEVGADLADELTRLTADQQQSLRDFLRKLRS